MLINASLPITEKIYLADKTLAYAKDLKIGDKILSLKITEDDVNDIADIYKNYINSGNRVFSNYEIGEATIFSAEKTDSIKFDTFKNKKITTDQYILTLPFPFFDAKNFNKNIVENSLMISTSREIQRSYNSSEKTSIDVDQLEETFQIAQINKNISSTLNDQISFQGTGKINKFSVPSGAYSLSIVGGHFYFTENFIVLAETGL
jgi:hypothetical protein